MRDREKREKEWESDEDDDVDHDAIATPAALQPSLLASHRPASSPSAVGHRPPAIRYRSPKLRGRGRVRRERELDEDGEDDVAHCSGCHCLLARPTTSLAKLHPRIRERGKGNRRV